MSIRPPSHPPGYEIIKNSKTYSMTSICSNCGHRQTIQIKKGSKVFRKTLDILCNRCGCQTLNLNAVIIWLASIGIDSVGNMQLLLSFVWPRRYRGIYNLLQGVNTVKSLPKPQVRPANWPRYMEILEEIEMFAEHGKLKVVHISEQWTFKFTTNLESLHK